MHLVREALCKNKSTSKTGERVRQLGVTWTYQRVVSFRLTIEAAWTRYGNQSSFCGICSWISQARTFSMHYVDLPYLRISISGVASGCGTGRAVESTRHSAVVRNERIVAFHRPGNVANERENVARREGRNMLMFKKLQCGIISSRRRRAD
jgi:hypothetical protein